MNSRFYYFLPSDLLSQLERTLKKSGKPYAWIAQEHAMMREHNPNMTVGLEAGFTMFHPAIGIAPGTLSSNLTIPEEFGLMPGWEGINPQQFGNEMETLEQRSASLHRRANGFCGWLLTNPAFLNEHDQLCKVHRDAIEGVGLRMWSGRPELESDSMPETDKEHKFALDVQRFCQRWWIERLDGPYLPVPFAAKLPVIGKLLGPVARMLEAGSLCYFPRTDPLPSADELRNILEDAARRRDAPSHLQGWMDIIHSSNSQKAEIATFARHYAIIHFHRVLYSRHADELKGARAEVKEAMAQFLQPGKSKEAALSTLDKDASSISKSLGNPDWYKRVSVLQI